MAEKEKILSGNSEIIISTLVDRLEKDSFNSNLACIDKENQTTESKDFVNSKKLAHSQSIDDLRNFLRNVSKNGIVSLSGGEKDKNPGTLSIQSEKILSKAFEEIQHTLAEFDPEFTVKDILQKHLERWEAKGQKRGVM